jgi:L-amino acid N-acyltransferase YncA
MELLFRPMTANDRKSVAEIYKQGIETGNVTFQQDIPVWEEWRTRIDFFADRLTKPMLLTAVWSKRG